MRKKELSKFHLIILRFIYLATALSVGYQAWNEIILPQGTWDPIYGVAYSIWASYAIIMLIGVFHPLKMMPLLLLQFFYKAVWIGGIFYPLYLAGEQTAVAMDLFKSWRFAVGIELLVIPWRYVYRQYFKYRPATVSR